MMKFFACSFFCLVVSNLLFARQISNASLTQNVKISQNDTIRLVQLIALARTFEEINPDSTYYYAEQSLELSRKLKIKLDEGRGLLEMGYALMNRGNYPQALQTILTAMEILNDPESEKNVLMGKFPSDDALLDRTTAPHAQRLSEIAFGQHILGLLYANSDSYDKAWHHHLLARQKAEQAGNVGLLSTINLTLNRVYLELGKTDSAMISIQKSYDQTIQSGFLKYLGSVLINTGRTYAATGDTAMATQYYRESLAASAKHGYFRGEIASNLVLADYYHESGKIDSAFLHIRDALSVAKKLDNPDLLLRSYHSLTRHYQTIGNIDSLVKYQAMIIAINEDLFNAKQAQEFQNIDFNAQLQQQQILAAEKEYRNRQQKNLLYGGLGVFLIIASMLFRNNRQKQKANQILEETLLDLKSTQAQLIESEKMASLGQLRLSELDTVKTKLYTNITHEFRTPLTVILGVTHQMLDNPDNQSSKSLQTIIRNSQNLLTLVNQMLDLSKLESGKLSLQNHHADVVSFLGYIVDSFHSLAENKGVHIHFISMAEQFNMDFDEVRLQQVVSNIISNAIKFTPIGGHVYISTDTKNESFFLKIKDTGIGITDADLPHIFDRFYQADDSHTRHGEGTGIGLSLTHELVKLMQGTIAVKSRIGHGTEFEVMLPIHTTSSPKENTVQIPSFSIDTEIENTIPTDKNAQSTLVSRIHPENGNAHVLIVDDNEDVLAFVASCLENEFDVELARNGQQCEDLAFKMIPDLIVMDVMMPFKDGFEVCKILKADERTSHIPIILLTAKADLESRLEGLEQGADDYLTKPFDKKELLLRIRNLLELRRQLQQYYLASLEESLQAKPYPNGSKNNSGLNSPIKVQTGTERPSIPLASSLENAFVIKVRKTIEIHLEDADFDVEKLCRSLALSHSQVHRKLSALTGLSATYFIRYIRLIKAKEMILKSGFSISAIAYDCGFNDPAYFSRIFKQEFGMSPQVWKEQNSTV
jgi:signal transduction histidine kinase/AraC-like DNA-binding protein/ActR/RegA family two-component response regulator